MKKPKAVLISDVHYSLPTLELAHTAMAAALTQAEHLKVPLIVAGDLHDSKASIRAEYANAILHLLNTALTEVIVIVGNHDLINEKGSEHALHFLFSKATVIDVPMSKHGLYFIPYQADPQVFRKEVNKIPNKAIVICHQGAQGADMGHYVVDKAQVDPEEFRNLRIISGHYHRRQNIGTWTYLGNPYTLTFGEASDGPKGYHVLFEDGSLEFHSLNFRKHLIINRVFDDLLIPVPNYNKGDKVWLKVHGTQQELDSVNKQKLGQALFGHSSYQLDLIPTDTVKQQFDADTLTGEEIFDKLIDATAETAERKTSLKALWRTLV